MKKYLVLFVLALTFGCSNNPESYIAHLNGYWEIDEVLLPDGTKRDYTFNDTIDFLSISDSLTGFRKKMRPNFDGTFTTSNDAEALRLVIEKGKLNIYYNTPYAEWKETVLKATETRLVLKNEDQIQYTYKRYEPLDLD